MSRTLDHLSLFHFNLTLQRNNVITYNRQCFYMCTSKLILKTQTNLEVFLCKFFSWGKILLSEFLLVPKIELQISEIRNKNGLALSISEKWSILLPWWASKKFLVSLLYSSETSELLLQSFSIPLVNMNVSHTMLNLKSLLFIFIG